SSGRKINHWWETPPDHLNPRELYKLDTRVTKLINPLYVTREKKTTTISSMHPTTNANEDFPVEIPSGYDLGH
ncbi:hypothetical protein Golob_004222, partial [Gossypium lobatum]|nr:hypothetical protein [Gossypium lobatum]